MHVLLANDMSSNVAVADACAARLHVNVAAIGREQWALALQTERAYGAPNEDEAATRALAHLRTVPDYYWREQQLAVVARSFWADRERPVVENARALAPRGATVERASALHSMVVRSAHYKTHELDASAHHHHHAYSIDDDDAYSYWFAGAAACIFLFFLIVIAASSSYSCPYPHQPH